MSEPADDRPVDPPGDWLTDRERWRRRIAAIVLVCGVALIVHFLSRPPATNGPTPPSSQPASNR